MNTESLLGCTASAVTNTGTHIAPTGGHLIVVALADVTVTGHVTRYPEAAATHVAAFTLLAGFELRQVKQITVSGLCQIFFFQS